MVLKICKTCNKEFKPYRMSKGIYCSHNCYWQDMIGKPHRHKTNNKAWNKGLSNAKTKANAEKARQGISSKDKEFYRRIGLRGLIKQQNIKQPTSIEKIVYDYLVLKDIIFEKQKLINGKFLVDAYIPSLNLIVEADGNYWHTLDRVLKKDKAENAYLRKCGYKLLRLTEEEIKNGKFKERMVF